MIHFLHHWPCHLDDHPVSRLPGVKCKMCWAFHAAGHRYMPKLVSTITASIFLNKVQMFRLQIVGPTKHIGHCGGICTHRVSPGLFDPKVDGDSSQKRSMENQSKTLELDPREYTHNIPTDDIDSAHVSRCLNS